VALLEHDLSVADARSAPTALGPDDGGVSRRSRIVWICAAVAGLATVSTARLLLRHHSIDMLYGEDGSVFLPAALRDGLAPIATPYQGYLHVVPRLLAFVVAQFPIEHAALAFTVAASLVTALLAVFVFFAAASWIDSAVTRGMLAAAMVLLPIAREEVVANAATLQWPLLFACFWALVGRPSGPVVRGAAFVVAAAAGLSSPIALLYVPVGIVLLVRSSSWRDRALPITLLVAASLQVVATATAGDRTISGEPIHDPVVLVRAFGERVAGGLVSWPSAPGLPGFPALIGLAAVVTLVAWIGLRHRSAVVQSRRAGLLVAYAVVVFVVPAWITGGASRYAYVPALFLLAAVGVLVRLQPRHAAIGALVLVAVWTASFSASSYRVKGPSWSAALVNAREECRSASSVRLPVGPYGAHRKPWKYAEFPCSSL
jgi:hypothetical protein